MGLLHVLGTKFLKFSHMHVKEGIFSLALKVLTSVIKKYDGLEEMQPRVRVKRKNSKQEEGYHWFQQQMSP